MKAHRYVRQVEQNELSEFETYPVLEAISKLDLGPCHVDLGKLATKFMAESETISAEDFVIRDGHIKPLPKPGLGVEIDETAVREAAKTECNWVNPVWRHDDGAIAEW